MSSNSFLIDWYSEIDKAFRRRSQILDVISDSSILADLSGETYEIWAFQKVQRLANAS